MLRRIIYFFLVAVLLGGFGGAIAYYAFDFKPKMIQTFLANAPKPTETISAESAREDQWQPQITAIGSVASVNGIDVTPQVAGIVKAIYFDSGQYVEQGAKLVDLDTDTEQADLDSLQAQFVNAQATLDRSSKVAAKGYLSKAELDQAQSEHDRLAALIQRTKALIAQKSIYAPWAGKLGLRQVDIGKYIAPGTPIVWIQSVDPVFIDFPVPEDDFGRIEVGQKVEAALPAFAGQVFEGEIVSSDARMSQGSRAITVRASMANPEHKLLPGMYANVTVFTGKMEPVVTVPQPAVTYTLYGNSVFVVVPAKEPDPNSKDEQLEVERRIVQTGEVRSGRVRVLDGLKPGERIVIAGQNKIEPGTRVKVDNSVALNTPQDKLHQ